MFKRRFKSLKMDIKDILRKGYLVSPSLMSKTALIEQVFEKIPKGVTVINETLINQLLSPVKEDVIVDYPVDILKNYSGFMKKREVDDFVNYFKNRYTTISEMLKGRTELQNSLSIRRFLGGQNKDVSFIGIVVDKRVSKNGNILVQLEDTTGIVTAIITKTKTDLFKLANDIVVDEVIGVTGACNGNFVFCNSLFYPDVPISNEFKKCGDDIYAAFISDIHVGSKMFLPKPLNNFIQWINGNYGDSYSRELASKVKYLFVVGDLVDGVGIYPEQDRELEIKDVNLQYEECSRYLDQIRKDIKIITCGGNHDALRLSEPQPMLDKDYAKSLYEIKNMQMVTNPSYVNIHKKNGFPGFTVLMYHGYSFDYYISNVESIRLNGGYDRADLVMKFLLQKRHLAPSHSSTLYIPDIKEDPLVIKDIPDFFVSGHIHKMSVGFYRGITTLCSSCWQGKTIFQEKVGHHPEPGRVPLINLGTREVKVMKFCD